jgi:hypothetical protein
MAAQSTTGRNEEQEWRYAATAMAWHGWGSPIGAGIFLVCLAGTLALLRYAVFG